MKIICIIILFLLIIPTVVADIKLGELKVEYTLGEFVPLTVIITNNETKKNLTICETLEYPSSTIVAPPLFCSLIELEPNQSIVWDKLGFFVDAMTSPGEYTYSAIVDNVILSKTFWISGTNYTFRNIKLFLCKDVRCADSRLTFLLNESPIYVKVFDTEEANLIGTLSKPDEIRQLIFVNNTAEVYFDKPGNYKVNVIAQKEGYFDYIMEKEFDVLANNSFSEPFCGNEICEKGENYKNCQQDCPLDISWIYWTVVILIGIMLTSIIIWKLKKKKSINTKYSSLSVKVSS